MSELVFIIFHTQIENLAVEYYFEVDLIVYDCRIRCISK